MVAERIGRSLDERLKNDSRISLIVSGGTTPGPVYDLLSRYALDWQRVDVCLTDERCVPRSHSASNERMLRARLLVNEASAARFVLLDESITTTLPPVSACTLVGMGEDGHFASLFPDSTALAAGLDLTAGGAVVAVDDAPDQLQRISMTLGRLAASDNLVLLAFGARKRAILKAPSGYPVQFLLAQNRSSVQVFWAL